MRAYACAAGVLGHVCVYFMHAYNIMCICAHQWILNAIKPTGLANSPPQALLEAHSFIYKLILEMLYALKVSTQHELMRPTTTLQYELVCQTTPYPLYS